MLVEVEGGQSRTITERIEGSDRAVAVPEGLEVAV